MLRCLLAVWSIVLLGTHMAELPAWEIGLISVVIGVVWQSGWDSKKGNHAL